jgi:hypothetical protein
MCADADECVKQMDVMFQSLDPSLQPQFQADHDTILDTYNGGHSFYTGWIPFNPQCETLYALGQQADQLTNAMIVATGGQPMSGLCCNAGKTNPLSLPSLSSSVLIFGLLALFLLLPRR